MSDRPSKLCRCHMHTFTENFIKIANVIEPCFSGYITDSPNFIITDVRMNTKEAI